MYVCLSEFYFFSQGLRDDQFLITTDDKIMPPVQEDASGDGEGDGVAKESSAAGAVSKKTIPLVVVLDNLRSAFNVGSIFRTAECVGASKMYLCGYTATPQDKQTQRTTMGTHEYVEWEHTDSTLELLERLRRDGSVHIVGLETVVGSCSLFDFDFPTHPRGKVEKDGARAAHKDFNKADEGTENDVEQEELKVASVDVSLEGMDVDGAPHVPQVLRETYRGNDGDTGGGGDGGETRSPVLALVVGNERFGIGPDVLEQCTQVVHIPCIGVKNSLNVSVAFATCAFEILRQWKWKGVA